MEALTSAERPHPAAQNDFCGGQRDTIPTFPMQSLLRRKSLCAIAAGEVQTLQEAVEELRRIRDEIITAVGGKEV